MSFEKQTKTNLWLYTLRKALLKTVFSFATLFHFMHLEIQKRNSSSSSVLWTMVDHLWNTADRWSSIHIPWVHQCCAGPSLEMVIATSIIYIITIWLGPTKREHKTQNGNIFSDILLHVSFCSYQLRFCIYICVIRFYFIVVVLYMVSDSFFTIKHERKI